VSTSTNVVLNFDEPIARGSGNVIIHKSDGTLTTIAITDATQVSVAGNTVTIDPVGNLAAGSDYYVTVDSGAIRDPAGNSYAGISSSTALNFTTLSAPNTSSTFLQVLDNSVLEGQSGTKTLSFGVVLSGPGAGSQAVSVHYETQDIVGATHPATAGQD